jgi:TnpA family transposase
MDRETTDKYINALFTRVVEWELMEPHWHDMMQVGLSIQASNILPSMLIQKLGVSSRQSTLSRSFSELGRAERTRFLLQYISDTAMRQHIRAETTKVESQHQFTDWIAFGEPVLRSGDLVGHEKRIKYRNLGTV